MQVVEEEKDGLMRVFELVDDRSQQRFVLGVDVLAGARLTALLNSIPALEAPRQCR